MNYLGRRFFAVLVATVFSVGTADAAAIVIDDDSTYSTYLRNEDVGSSRPLVKRIKGQIGKSGNAFIPKGARFGIRNVKPLDAAELNKGDRVRFALAEDFLVNDRVVIAKDTELVGTVVTAKRGKLNIDVKNIITDDGVTVALNGNVGDVAKGRVYFRENCEFFVSVATDTDLGFALTNKNNVGKLSQRNVIVSKDNAESDDHLF